MSKERILLLVGLIEAITPLSGFPTTWKKIIISIGGLLIIYIAYILHNQKKKYTPKNKVEVFTENRGFNETIKSTFE